jgi:HEAT repeat protein
LTWKNFTLWLVTAASLPGAAAFGESSLEEALRRLRADDILVSDSAVEEIAALGGAGADSLLALLDDERRDVRAGAIRGLGLLGEARAAPRLRELLRELLRSEEPATMEDRYFRILAIQALGRIGDASSADLLREALEAGDPFDRAHAGISLFLLGEDPGYDLVRECLADTSVAIRSLSVEGIAGSADPRAAGLVLAATEDGSWVVRDSAYRALGRWLDRADCASALRRGAQDPSWYVRETVAEMEALRAAPARER